MYRSYTVGGNLADKGSVARQTNKAVSQHGGVVHSSLQTRSCAARDPLRARAAASGGCSRLHATSASHVDMAHCAPHQPIAPGESRCVGDSSDGARPQHTAWAMGRDASRSRVGERSVGPLRVPARPLVRQGGRPTARPALGERQTAAPKNRRFYSHSQRINGDTKGLSRTTMYLVAPSSSSFTVYVPRPTRATCTRFGRFGPQISKAAQGDHYVDSNIWVSV